MSSMPVPWLVAGASGMVLAILMAGVMLAVRRRRSTLDYLLHRIAWERLTDVVIPEEVEGEIHLDLALLTPRGILVLEVRRASGTLFWGEQLESWTVLDGARRTVLRNPLPGLKARQQAVQQLTRGAPVDGRVLLVGKVAISGGSPPGVVLQEDLATEFPARGREPPPARLRDAWQALADSARPL
jgi:hypothetical protein